MICLGGRHTRTSIQYNMVWSRLNHFNYINILMGVSELFESVISFQTSYLNEYVLIMNFFYSDCKLLNNWERENVQNAIKLTVWFCLFTNFISISNKFLVKSHSFGICSLPFFSILYLRIENSPNNESNFFWSHSITLTCLYIA